MTCPWACRSRHRFEPFAGHVAKGRPANEFSMLYGSPESGDHLDTATSIDDARPSRTAHADRALPGYAPAACGWARPKPRRPWRTRSRASSRLARFAVDSSICFRRNRSTPATSSLAMSPLMVKGFVPGNGGPNSSAADAQPPRPNERRINRARFVACRRMGKSRVRTGWRDKEAAPRLNREAAGRKEWGAPGPARGPSVTGPLISGWASSSFFGTGGLTPDRLEPVLRRSERNIEDFSKSTPAIHVGTALRQW